MNLPLAANFEATNVTFLPKKLASNVQSSCIDNSKRPKSMLCHYCIKATIYIYRRFNAIVSQLKMHYFSEGAFESLISSQLLKKEKYI